MHLRTTEIVGLFLISSSVVRVSVLSWRLIRFLLSLAVITFIASAVRLTYRRKMSSILFLEYQGS